eukprot:CAMPEP_0113597182 /NCGR_PEP_ID=MMETSP0015_2-20120614/40847_1 /TAXON_ID=2838 /ORGANISM="Odontella" /LENGTH=609 /DNA_ID=CAMNT_0000504975 /DNA_START=79 /DNA_END=1908 /DNA_ORIENTATION=- /assembly_acc=CAM_ASM_000160
MKLSASVLLLAAVKLGRVDACWLIFCPDENPDTEAEVPGPTSSNPTSGPTSRPPTLGPTTHPTFVPSGDPTTIPPTRNPTFVPTFAPSSGIPRTHAPTERPSRFPTNAPTRHPTMIFLIETPTKAPSNEPTLSQTEHPTPASTINNPVQHQPDGEQPRDDAVSWSQEGKRLHGLSEFGGNAETIFQYEYGSFVKNFYQTRGIESKIIIDIEKVTLPEAPSRARSLKGNALKLSFFQESKFPHGLPNVTMGDFIQDPLKMKLDRDNFRDVLKSYREFSGLHFVSHTYLPSSLEEKMEPEPESIAQSLDSISQTQATTGNAKTWAILSAVLGVLGVVLIFGALYYAQRKQMFAKRESARRRYVDVKKQGSDTTERPEFLGSDEESQLDIINTLEHGDENTIAAQSKWQLSLIDGDDGISTLVDPTPSQPNLDAPSLARSTYDAPSIAAFTFDQSTIATKENDQLPLFQEGSKRFFLLPKDLFPGQGQPSFNSALGNPVGSSASKGKSKKKTGSEPPQTAFREELVIIRAAPGRLGLVIDATMDGPPTIHSIKDSSPLVGQVLVGDRLLAVDDVNVVSMSSIQVTKIITDKSDQETRKLSILRTVPFPTVPF